MLYRCRQVNAPVHGVSFHELIEMMYEGDVCLVLEGRELGAIHQRVLFNGVVGYVYSNNIEPVEG